MKKQVQDWTGLIRSRLKEGEDYIKQNWMESRNELIETFDDRSAELRRGFLTLFGSEGAVVSSPFNVIYSFRCVAKVSTSSKNSGYEDSQSVQKCLVRNKGQTVSIIKSQ